MKDKSLTKIDQLSNSFTKFLGTPLSIVLHTVFFIGIFLLVPLGFSLDQVMLILTTAVSLEAIYLSLFIQMSVNKASESLRDVEEDIEEIQEDVEQLDDNLDEVQENVEEDNFNEKNISEQLLKLHEEIVTLRKEMKNTK